MTSQQHHDIPSARPHFAGVGDFAPDWIVTPGDTIGDVLEERGWSQAELANRTGFTKKHIYQLLRGEAPITQETAQQLEKVLGSTARFWMGLDIQYRDLLAKREEQKSLAKEASWLKELPLADMIRFGWVSKSADKGQQVKECLKFFAISSVSAWREMYRKPVAAYRAPPKLSMNGPAVAAWLREGERQAGVIRCEAFDRNAFQAALVRARGLTRQSSPAAFLPELTRMCAQAGVAVVLAPAPKGCPTSGATKWVNANRALIMLSMRGKTDDNFWFTFFHEAAHILKHGKSLTFLDVLGESGLRPEEEAEADAFACDYMISPTAWGQFVGEGKGKFSAAKVDVFASRQGISPGIVVGRLQHEGRIPFTHLNALKVSYRWNVHE